MLHLRNAVLAKVSASANLKHFRTVSKIFATQVDVNWIVTLIDKWHGSLPL